MITVTCPACLDSREVKRAQALEMPCRRCLHQARADRQRRARRLAAMRAFPALLRRTTDLVDRLRELYRQRGLRLRPEDVAPLTRDLLQVESRLVGLVDAVAEDLIARDLRDLSMSGSSRSSPLMAPSVARG